MVATPPHPLSSTFSSSVFSPVVFPKLPLWLVENKEEEHEVEESVNDFDDRSDQTRSPAFVVTTVGSAVKATDQASKMITDDDLGFIANFLGIFIFALVIAYHYVLADPKYEAN
ncbi:hypothetical protein L6452_11983 [Arctium lappa]|uniref:Uncharacterized protein n=1 Tax=Arctium lappa TaxID=4217 RepID=A0ACB9DQ69_ARCLA|nr:hypothetical protein L6452_11983 [Arctium lappa]